MLREEYVYFADKESRILELGPLNRPLVDKKKYKNAYTLDIRTTEEVKKLYCKNDYLETTGIYVDVDTIVDIDIVLKSSYKETFKDIEKFDYIVASHVIEHVPNILDFFSDIKNALKPDGKLIILYPDKRYCFDHFRESASFRDAYDVYSRGIKENARMVLDFIFSAISENDPRVFWMAENMQTLISDTCLEKAKLLYEAALSGIIPDDVHYWPFTDESFIRFVYDSTRASLMPFECIDFVKTQENTQEFYVTLQVKENNNVNKDKILNNLKSILETTNIDYFNSKQIKLIYDYNSTKDLFDENKNKCIELEQIIKKLKLDISERDENLYKYKEDLVNNTLQIKEKDFILENTRNELVKRENSLKEYRELIEKNKELLVEKDLNILDIKKVLMEKERALQSVETQLINIINSEMWRFTKPIRAFLDLLKKQYRK